MKREIKFRAISCELKNFVFGYIGYSPGCGVFNISESNGWQPSYSNPDEGERNVYHEVKYETIGQFTGKKDTNGKEIYEGDIVKTDNESNVMVIEWCDKFASFVICKKGWLFRHFFGEGLEANKCEIIGNIYENPELVP
jgi:uncharacterized phage protein (TIGR01671 family)